MRGHLLLAVPAALLLACAGCGTEQRAPGADTTASAAAAGTTTAAPSAAAPVAVFLGDSHTAASDDGGGYALRTAAAMGWTPVLEGVGATGYATTNGSGGGTYAERLEAVVAAAPDVVVVQGSINDVHSPPAAVRSGADAVYGELARRLPGSDVVVVGPPAAPGVPEAAVLAVRDEVQRAAAAAGVLFLDPVAGGWLAPADGKYADPYHPNDVGYAVFADQLVAALRAAGL
ncbi:SGNH/GDSL hydrolase family protein [Modestobacter versicolor]|uniref:SGNH/GDSL hydrolase family protein n=1 Tax=Modestobacter versicolor TaxID=429133 RepID=UPI0034E043A3